MDPHYPQPVPQVQGRPLIPYQVIPPNINERQIPSVPEPATRKPTDQEFFADHDPGFSGHTKFRLPNHQFLKQHFFREGRLSEEQALYILEHTTEILATEPNMVQVKSPVTICGDIHGQYYDLMKLFEVGGSVADNTYLFLGDYVDRGCFGIECLLYLYTLKLCYPTQFVLLRGNHECERLTEYFTFRSECLHKYSARVYQACVRSFCALPITAIVDGRFFCVHGGLSPELVVLEDIERMDRFQEPGSQGLLCDLLWSDPVAKFGNEEENGISPGTTFMHNGTRGCSFFFTYEATCKFLERNGLLGVIRGHEAQDAGYTMHRKTPTKKFPSVITIFSAPNYLDVYHNRGAVLKYANKSITIRQYNSSAHPYWLPNFMDAFTWSLPFVGAKITEMLLAILSICSEEELIDSDSSDDDTRTIADIGLTPAEIQKRRQEIKTKIMAVGRMQRVFQLLREEAETTSELAVGEDALNLAPVIPSDALGVQDQRMNIHSFEDARRSDVINERLPQFDPGAAPTGAIFPVPSMRITRRRGSGEEGNMNMEVLIRRTLEEEDQPGGLVEVLADRIARGRKVTGRPRALKRHETA